MVAVDADDFDRIVNTWAAEQTGRTGRGKSNSRGRGDGIASGGDGITDPGWCGSAQDDSGNIPGADLVGVAVDATAVRGAKHEDGTRSRCSQHSDTTSGW